MVNRILELQLPGTIAFPAKPDVHGIDTGGTYMCTFQKALRYTLIREPKAVRTCSSPSESARYGSWDRHLSVLRYMFLLIISLSVTNDDDNR